jgi:hypothetical protein
MIGLTTLVLDFRGHRDSVGPPAAEVVVATLVASESQRLCPNLASLSYADLEDTLDRAAFADMVLSRCTTAGDSKEFRRLYSVAVYSGQKRAGWRLRGIPGLEVELLNAKKGRPALQRWRGY